MTKKTAAEAVQAIVTELTPFESLERSRIVRASWMLLGESDTKIEAPLDEEAETLPKDGDLPLRARTWLKQNTISADQLHQVFHIDSDKVEVIAAEIPGITNKEKVRNAYVLAGLAQLLAMGDAKFEDKTARALCERYGFYDYTNHSKYVKGGNEFTGTRTGGMTLTSPGLKRGAALVLELSKNV